ncbi:CRISPR-associated protein Csx18 [[Limnothrix rosea] IAM M-220]|uniref:CRISPR-associated protein Csx18 n=1 Tax=[Limnothrix rosea] IAM M-220 TaxID=454133 RepID=UPI00095B86FE|nr:CRISPR-associated protein Csx18 [[Limnothrix rosea] IAM M-220]OKH15985.1 hypothetical protein NIES208_12335 [[Limnothrix rosea] IAM M-220]
MYLAKRGIFVRNSAAAIANGGITLVILLIAPLGLAAVIMNTLLVMGSTFVVCGVMDGITIWLLKGGNPVQMSAARRRGDLYPPDPHSDLDPPRRSER